MRKRKSRYNALIFFALCVAVAFITQLIAGDYRRADSKTPIADFSYTDLNGKTGSLSQIQGPVVVHFWATWCSPCIKELPELLKKAETADDHRFLLIAADQVPQTVGKFLEVFKIPANVTPIVDSNLQTTGGIFGVTGFPETFILNADHTVKRHLTGTVPWVSFDAL